MPFLQIMWSNFRNSKKYVFDDINNSILYCRLNLYGDNERHQLYLMKSFARNIVLVIFVLYKVVILFYQFLFILQKCLGKMQIKNNYQKTTPSLIKFWLSTGRQGPIKMFSI